MKVLKIIFLIVLSGTLYFVLNIDKNENALDNVGVIKNQHIEVNKNNHAIRLPNYDPTKQVQKKSYFRAGDADAK